MYNNIIIQKIESFCERDNIQYYRNVILEIQELENIIYKIDYTATPFPKTDIAYRKNLIVSYNDDENKYNKFVDTRINNLENKE